MTRKTPDQLKQIRLQALAKGRETQRKRRKLTLKQRKWIKRTLETSNATQAAIEVYNTTDRATATAIASENLRKPLLKEALEKALEAQGLTDSQLVSDAYHFVNKAKQEEVKVKASDGIRALELLMKAKGMLKAGSDNRSLTLNYTDMNKSELQTELERLRRFKQRVLSE